MSDEKVVSKIKKLLALAGNNPSEAEAEAAMLAAQTILARHSLTMQDLQVAESGMVAEKAVEPHGRLAWWQRVIGAIVAKNFRCHGITRRDPAGGTRMILIGRPEDAEVAIYVAAIAIRTANREANAFARSFTQARAKQPAAQLGLCSPATRAFSRMHRLARNDFLTGFIRGMGEAFQRNVEQTGTALMLVTPKEVTDYLEAMNLASPRRARIMVGDSDVARDAGWETGRSFSFDEALTEGETPKEIPHA